MRPSIITLRTSISLLLAPNLWAGSPSAWIWTSTSPGKDETALLRADFTLPTLPTKAAVRWSCDNQAELVINGKSLGTCENWDAPAMAKLDGVLKAGENWLATTVKNEGAGAAGLVLEVLDTSVKPPKVLFSSQEGWKWQREAPADWKTAPTAATQPVAKIGDYGMAPWGTVFASQSDKMSPEAASIKAPAGFNVELVYSVPKAEQGSWVSLTIDDKGRFLAGDQDGKVYRLTLGQENTVEQVPIKAGHAQGLLYANKSLYVVVNQGSKSGLYRCVDQDGDGAYEEETLLKSFDGGGEHGPHQVVLGPDGKSLYLAGGNHTKLPEVQGSLVPPIWQEDLLLPRMWDANGHATNIFAPGGWFCKTDLEGKTWTTFSMGFRNQYDLAFSPTGEAFTYDSDMEWDVGMPWYRPTRINHVTPGSEHGWRSGSGVWPTHYMDSLAPVVDIGPGSPTGCVFGTGAKFPEKYQRAFYAADWTYGTLYAVHLAPDGSGYTGTKEAFLTGRPLPISDVVVHPDGAMYVLVGGRKVQSGLYKVTYSGTESTAPVAPEEPKRMAKQRHELEALLAAPPSPAAVAQAIAYLGNQDRLLRYTARTLLELQPLEQWQEKAFAEKVAPTSTIDAMACLCRRGDKSLQPRILEVLRSVHDQGLREAEMLDLFRVYTLCFTRMGRPTDATVLQRLREQFEPMYPSPSPVMNKEISEMLVFLDSKQIVGKLLLAMQASGADTKDDAMDSEQLKLNSSYASAFMDARASRPNRLQISLAYALQYAKEGWTPELRRSYFRWFNTALKWKGGHSFQGFIKNMRKTALEHVPAEMKTELEGVSQTFLATTKELPLPKGPGQPYDLEMLVSLITPERLKGRDYAHGKKMYQAALCSSCHQFAGEYGGVGPDITGAAGRYSVRDLLENIVLPSKVISDQYGSTLLEKNDGSSVVGRIMSEDDTNIQVAENPLQPETLTALPKAEVKTRSAYPVSAMPPALVNNLNENEVLDLMAFILSGGKADDAMFSK